jgi:hypothetical protein
MRLAILANRRTHRFRSLRSMNRTIFENRALTLHIVAPTS